MRRRSAGPAVQVALCVATILAALSGVAWRQGQALEAFTHLERVSREAALADTEIGELNRSIHYLESRGRVIREAREHLDMHLPATDEMMFLPGEAS